MCKRNMLKNYKIKVKLLLEKMRNEPANVGDVFVCIKSEELREKMAGKKVLLKGAAHTASL